MSSICNVVLHWCHVLRSLCTVSLWLPAVSVIVRRGRVTSAVYTRPSVEQRHLVQLDVGLWRSCLYTPACVYVCCGRWTSLAVFVGDSTVPSDGWPSRVLTLRPNGKGPRSSAAVLAPSTSAGCINCQLLTLQTSARQRAFRVRGRFIRGGGVTYIVCPRKFGADKSFEKRSYRWNLPNIRFGRNHRFQCTHLYSCSQSLAGRAVVSRRHVGDIQRQRMTWHWNVGLGLFKIIENRAVR